MPGDWHPLQYVVSPMAWFFGTWLIVGLFIQSVKLGAPKIARRVRPAIFRITAEGGRKAYATIKCERGKGTIRADGKIVKCLDDSPNPFPHLFQCMFSLKGEGRSKSSITLAKDEWAHIFLASIHVPNYGGLSIHVQCGQLADVVIPDAGILLELQFKRDTGTDISTMYWIRRNDMGPYTIEVRTYDD